MMELLPQLVVSGLVTGSVYAVIAIGFTLVYSATTAINFAQGEFVMLGGMVSYALHALAGIPLLAAVPLAILVVTALGALFERLTIYPLGGITPMTLIMITIGGSIVLKGGALLLLGKDTVGLPSFSGDAPLRLGTATIPRQGLWVLGIAAGVMTAIEVFFRRTLLGKAFRAAASNPYAATLMGVEVRRIVLVSFALSAALGAIAGAIVAPITTTAFDRGTMLGLKGFCAAVVGGLGSGPGVIAGGLLLGVLESLGAGLLSSGYKDAIAFGLLIVTLLVRPRGLFGPPDTTKV
jgi:branched-chain amino acid transport system permease protein